MSLTRQDQTNPEPHTAPPPPGPSHDQQIKLLHICALRGTFCSPCRLLQGPLAPNPTRVPCWKSFNPTLAHLGKDPKWL